MKKTVQVRFRNEPFMARVQGFGDIPNGWTPQSIKCTPVVYDNQADCGICGVGILFEDGRCWAWGPASPRDLITAWRATEVLRHLNDIPTHTMCKAYYTGIRNPGIGDYEEYVWPIVSKIGEEAYRQIMSLPVPEVIIQAIINNQTATNPPNLWPIEKELLAGTITWRSAFDDFDIQRPS